MANENIVFLDSIGYVNQAENVIKKMKYKAKKLTTTQIRKILSLVNDIYADVITLSIEKKQEKEFEEYLKERLQYFKMRCLYEAGRDDKGEKGVRDFVLDAKLVEYVDLLCNESNPQILRKNFVLLFHYIEALVAFHRYMGGRDK